MEFCVLILIGLYVYVKIVPAMFFFIFRDQFLEQINKSNKGFKKKMYLGT